MENSLVETKDINSLLGNRTKTDIITTIEDMKTIYNLDNKVDFKINDCKGEVIKVKDILLKVFEIPEKCDENGNVILEKETKKITILVSNKGASYVTASKVFANQLLTLISYFGIEKLKGGFTIKIIEKTMKNSKNKALGFELLD